MCFHAREMFPTEAARRFHKDDCEHMITEHSAHTHHVLRYLFIVIFTCVATFFVLVILYYTCLRNCLEQYKIRRDMMRSSCTSPIVIIIEVPVEAPTSVTMPTRS